MPPSCRDFAIKDRYIEPRLIGPETGCPDDRPMHNTNLACYVPGETAADIVLDKK